LLTKIKIGMLVYLVLKSSYVDSRMNSPNTQVHNKTNATIISTRIV
jgi:hypothetical protein